VLLALVFAAAVLLMDCVPLEPMPYRSGGYLDRDVYARVTFQVYSPAETEQARRAAARKVPAVIELNQEALETVCGQLKGLPDKLKAATQPAQLDETLRERFDLTQAKDLADFARLAVPDRAADYAAQIEQVREKLLAWYVVTGGDYAKAYHDKDTDQVRVVVGGSENLCPKSSLISLDNSRGMEAFVQAAAGAIDAPIHDNVLHYLRATFAAGTSLFRLDAEATEAAEEAARRAVPPQTEAKRAGTLLVSRTTDRGLSDSEVALLAAERAEYLRSMIAAVVVLLCLYVFKYERSVARDPWRGLSVVGVLTLMLLLTKAVVGMAGLNPYLAAFSVFAGAAVLTIAFDQRFAFAVTGALVVLTILLLRAGMDELLVLWAVAAAAVFQLREVRTRSRLIETGAVTATVALVGVWAIKAAGDVPARFALVDGGYAFAAAIAGGFIVQGILPLVERIFRTATSLTLLEWCDANKPLLKRLALEAPGTYSHSLLLGTMCEAAAEAIGANGLLARVGAYYHDIGKINKPEYFGENRSGPGSKHDKLSPAMSLLIIKGHVKDGLEMARQYGLPRVLLEFITTHHGTTLVEYFYHAAAQQRREDAERAPDEVEFRYPGPKPHLKEAAILMLADAAESAVRAMSEPTVGRIETQVHTIIFKRLMDGQLDECEVTLKEVRGIEESLVKSLCGIHHARVRYPSQSKAESNGEDRTPDGTAPPSSGDADAEGDRQGKQ